MKIPLQQEMNHFLGSISETRIMGVIPLGMILHISISAAITIFLLKRGMKFRNVAIVVFIIGISKEILDCFVINNTVKKHIIDMCYDMSYPAFLYVRGLIGQKIKELKMKHKSKY